MNCPRCMRGRLIKDLAGEVACANCSYEPSVGFPLPSSVVGGADAIIPALPRSARAALRAGVAGAS